jgi:hypothetical protein
VPTSHERGPEVFRTRGQLQVLEAVSHEPLQQSESCPHESPGLPQLPPPELPPLLLPDPHVLLAVSHVPLQQSES